MMCSAAKRPPGVPRRDVLACLLALCLPAGVAASDLADLLRAGGCVLLLRHAATDPGFRVVWLVTAYAAIACS